MSHEHIKNQTASQNYPGVAINQGDDDKVDKCLVDERTKTLNNNRNNEK